MNKTNKFAKEIIEYFEDKYGVCIDDYVYSEVVDVVVKRLLNKCNIIFTKEIKQSKKSWKEFKDNKQYERELYWYAIKSFKQEFFKRLKSKLDIKNNNGGLDQNEEI